MEIHFFGTRGSIPTPGPTTQEHGGNTACTLIKSSSSQLILDAGTGIRVLGDSQILPPVIDILITHNHWDHIQGFPFFAPIYQENRVINIYVAPTSPNQPDAILTQMSGSQFPVQHQALAANIKLIELDNTAFSIADFTILPVPLNHPNNGFGYIIEHNNKRVAYITDNELHTMTNPATCYAKWCQQLKHCDLLIHDAQFSEQELLQRHNWGHSSFEQAIELALDAKIKHLALYSHAPERTDAELRLLLKELSAHYCGTNSDFNFCFSKEGQIIKLE